MLVSVSFSLAQSDAVNQTGVVESIGHNGVLWSETSLEKACVGVEAAWIQNTVFYFVESGNLSFEFFVNILSATNKSDRRHAVPMSVQSTFCCGYYSGMIG